MKKNLEFKLFWVEVNSSTISLKTRQLLQEQWKFRNVTNVGNVRTVENVRRDRQTDTKCHTFSEPETRGDLNDDGHFRNGLNLRNVRTDIKCHTFLEPQPQADFNDDGNLRNGGDIMNVGNDRNVGHNSGRDQRPHNYN